MPLALKIFLLSLGSGVAGGYGGFRLGFWLALKFLRDDEMKEPLAVMIAIASCVAVGVASAVTTGVIAGKATKK